MSDSSFAIPGKPARLTDAVNYKLTLSDGQSSPALITLPDKLAASIRTNDTTPIIRVPLNSSTACN